ncbi:MAG: isocitrate/isopropylmalate dehydrogenase family protein [Lentisphaeria bacterium]|jgi:tartrate dehydrogenase/decarboxylase/D-malate dehydrogenase
MTLHRIAVYPGDGIGIEVTAEAMNALKAVADLGGFKLDLVEFDWGQRHWAQTGKCVPADYLKILAEFPAIYLGALGFPAQVPDHISVQPLIEMRQVFDQYANVRPAKLFPNVRTPLAGRVPADIDLVIVRENSEGEYVTCGGFFKGQTPDGMALQTNIHTRKGVERILRYGFDLARQRPRKRLTMVTKSNALKIGMLFWDQVLDDIKGDYPDIQLDKVYVDAMVMKLVQRPQDYDVLVCSNMYGDILSDLTGAIAGSIGLAPSANLNPERKHPSLFEPVHGSAPDIAGKGLANPLAAIRSVAMMLDFLGHPEAAARIEAAVLASVSDGRCVTPDLGGTATTSQVGDDIVRRLRQG